MVDDIRALASYDVALAPTSAEAAELSRELALSGGALSCMVCSASSWVERLWELAGDGRRFVDGVTRIVAMGIALEGRSGLGGPHLPALLAQHMRTAVGTAQLDAALALVREGGSPEGLLPSELEVLRALAAYEDELDILGLVEEGSAIAYLTNHPNDAFPRPLHVAVVGSAPLAPQLTALLEAGIAAGRLDVSRLGQESAELAPPAEGVSLRFAFPSGRYAVPQLVLKAVDELAAKGPILVSSRTPAKLYRALEPALSARGLTAAMRGSAPLAGTLLGRLAIALARALESAELPWDKAALADALANPLVHVDARARTRYDALLRENLLLEGTDAFGMRPFPERTEGLVAFVLRPTRETLAAAKAALAGQAALSGAERDELYAALDAFESAIGTSEALGHPLPSLNELLQGPLGGCSIALKHANAEQAPGECADVLIEGMAQAAAEPKARFSTVLALDLDADSFPAAKKAGAIDLLMERLGVPLAERPIERQRRQLRALAQLPAHTLILGRCLADAKGDPTYPAAVLEEFVDLYREDVTLSDDIDNIYALPEALQEGLMSCGEDALEADVWPGVAPACPRAPKEPKRVSLIAMPSDGASPSALRLSPGQIEAYLDCPAKWLYSRRFDVGSLDETMGPRELGIYRHDVLQRFYLLFRAEGQAKVCAENIDRAKATLKRAMAEVMGEYLALNEDGRPKRALDRCVALPQSSEARTIEHVQEELMEWLGFEASFLPGPATDPGANPGASPSAYVPRAFELDLSGYGVSFAGAQLIGRIDRVDVSLDGSSFVVVDYKGRVGASHAPALSEGKIVLPTKLQALIYAAAIARTPALQEALGLARGGIESIAGAVYVSYLRGHAIRGTFAERLTRERHLPTLPAKAEPLSAEDMAALIDEVERLVAEKVVRPILAGNVEALPLKGACEHCPAQGCARRGWADASQR